MKAKLILLAALVFAISQTGVRGEANEVEVEVETGKVEIETIEANVAVAESEDKVVETKKTQGTCSLALDFFSYAVHFQVLCKYLISFSPVIW